jgi:hypothetical protein
MGEVVGLLEKYEGEFEREWDRPWEPAADRGAGVFIV